MQAVPERLGSWRAVGWVHHSSRSRLAFGEGALAAVLMSRTRCKPSDPPRPSDPIEIDQGSDSIHARAQGPEFPSILNWPQDMLSAPYIRLLSPPSTTPPTVASDPNPGIWADALRRRITQMTGGRTGFQKCAILRSVLDPRTGPLCLIRLHAWCCTACRLQSLHDEDLRQPL